MKVFTRPIVLLSAVALIALGFAGAYAQNRMAAEPVAVAVVDLEELLENLDERTEREADVARERERLQQEAEQKRSQVQQIRNELDMLKAGTSNFREKQAELEQAAIELNVWTQYQQQRVNRETGLMIEDLYRKCLDAVEAAAKDAGYDMVFFKESSPDFDYENPQQLSAQITVRKLLWSSDEVDITNDVAQRMNNAYNNE
ncbi:MAG: OmpH family outer membrane protein [Phycisphaeraceae bacterium]